MRKLPVLFIFFFILFCSCRHDYNIDISYHDPDDEYAMEACYPKNKTGNVDQYLNRTLGTKLQSSFKNSRFDGVISLDDHAVFYKKISRSASNKAG